MKKRLSIKIFAIAILPFIIIGGVKYFSNERYFSAGSLNEVSYHGYNITILGDYIFYNEKNNILGSSLTAKNIENGTKKTVSDIHGWRVYLYNNKLYYLNNSCLKVENHIAYKELNGFFELKISNIPIDSFLIDGDNLYYNPSWKMGDDKIEERGHVFRINLKNRQEEKVLPYEVSQYQVYDEYLYFTRSSDENYEIYKKLVSSGIYRYSLKDKSEKKILDDIVGEFCIENGDLFYSEYTADETNKEVSGTYDLVKFDLDSNEKEILAEDILAFYVFNGNVCYVKAESPDVVNVLNLSSNRNKTVKADGLDYSKDFVFFNDRIYYYNSQDEFCEELIK